MRAAKFVRASLCWAEPNGSGAVVLSAPVTGGPVDIVARVPGLIGDLQSVENCVIWTVPGRGEIVLAIN